MKILIVHNRYQQAGGEDSVVKTEFNLLKSHGEEVRLYERSNDELKEYSFLKKLSFAWGMGWSNSSYEDLRKILKEFTPDVVHVHNIFFTLTPSIYQACRDENIPVVQSLHNFRLLCSNALFFRDNKVCEECLDHKNLWRGVRYGCYKNSRIMTVFLVRMLETHWKKGTWLKAVDVYITATEFGRRKYIEGGLPAEKIVVKPHVEGSQTVKENRDKGYALYAGRLTPEKGVEVLLKAWKKKSLLPLKIVGDGPMAAELKRQAQDIKDVEFLGFVAKDRYEEYLSGAKFLIVPSLCYENFPKVVAEAYACGVPVIASSLGGFSEIIHDQKTGLLFRAGDADDLLEKIKWFLTHTDRHPEIKQNIRELYTTFFSPRKNYEMLMDIYRQAIANRRNLAKV